MYSVFKNKNKIIRIFQKTESDTILERVNILKSINKENGFEIYKPYRIGVELIENHGGRVCYGYMSAYIIPNNHREIGVGFDYNNLIVEKEVTKSSIYNSETIDAGLPCEFRHDVEEYIFERVSSENNIPWCNIVFDQFMHCTVGSSICIYTSIILIILKLIDDNNQEHILNYKSLDFMSNDIKVCENMINISKDRN